MNCAASVARWNGCDLRYANESDLVAPRRNDGVEHRRVHRLRVRQRLAARNLLGRGDGDYRGCDVLNRGVNMAACRNQLIRDGAQAIPRSCPQCGLNRHCPRGVPDTVPAGAVPEDIRPMTDALGAVLTAQPLPAAPERKGDWMQTYTGGAFWPLDPRPEEVRIEDISHALSKICRYGGQTTRFYSVAEHCVHIARCAPDDMKLEALMHDASEAYLCDIIRPIKSHLSNYLDIERGLEEVIAKRFNLRWPWAPEVKRLDTAILADERDQVMAPPPMPWPQTTEPALGVELQFWTPQKAEYEFTVAFYRYGGHYC